MSPSSQGHDDPSYRSSSTSPDWRIWGTAAGCGLIMFVAALVAAAPAELAGAFGPQLQEASFSGSFWHGSARMPQGSTVKWAVSPLQTIRTRSPAGGWSFEAANSRLNGRMQLGRSLSLTDITGVVSIADLSHMADADLGTCALSARIENAQLILGDDRIMLEGAATTHAGRCAGRDVPALDVVSASTDGASKISVRAAGTVLSTVALGNLGDAVITVTPAGSRLFLGRVTTSETILEIGARGTESDS